MHTVNLKAPSHYNKLAQHKFFGKIWHSLVYAEVCSDFVLKSLFIVSCKFAYVVVFTVLREFSTRDKLKSWEILERFRNILSR